MTNTELHPVVEAAARDAELPEWARCKPDRQAHCVRVGELLSGWAVDLGLPDRDVARWRATGVLHDALKDADPDELKGLVAETWPPPVVHGPACAARLRTDGVEDPAMLNAIAYHPVGHPDLDALGRFLILADFLDPGRSFRSDERRQLRDRLPAEVNSVLAEVLTLRIQKLLTKRRAMLACTVDMWNGVVSE